MSVMNPKTEYNLVKTDNHKNYFVKDLWVVIPAHNEEKRIRVVLCSLKKYTKNIIVVDDGSTDSTYDIVCDQDVICLRHIVNFGKGSALKTGCDFALKMGAKFMVVMDADGQHRVEDIPKLIAHLFEDNNDIVFGVRTWNQNMPTIFKIGNIILSKYVGFMFRIKISDTQSGFRAFTSVAYKKIRWDATDYSMESEMIARAGKNRLKYAQEKIKTIYLDRYKGTTIIDGIKVALSMLFWKMR